MKLPNIPTKGIVSIEKLRMLLFGVTKIGKTTLLSGFPNALFLMTEKNYEHLKVYPIDIKSWEDFLEAIDLITKTKHNFKYIIIDTVDDLYNHCSEYVCDKLGIAHESEGEYGLGWTMVKNEFTKKLNKLFVSNYGLIFTSHVKVQETLTRGGKSTKMVPTMSNGARNILLPKVSVVGFMKPKTIKTSENKYIERRVISFKPSEFEEVGDRNGVLPEEIISYKDPQKTFEEFKKCYSLNKQGGDVKTK
jgi:hypothetical protein